MLELIQNGDFEAPGHAASYTIVDNYGAWNGNNFEVGNENLYFSGGDASNSIIELDGNSSEITVLQQSFNVARDDQNAELSFDLGARNTSGGFAEPSLVEVLDSSNTVIFSQVVTPTSSGSFDTLTFNFQFGPAGAYTLRFTEQGTNEGLGNILDNVSLMVCYALDTQIATPFGEKKIQDLEVGDLVTVADGGVKPIQWIGSKKLTCVDLLAHPEMKPVSIQANALGKGLPSRDLLVSPQHRMLVRSKISQTVLGDYEALVPAKKLTYLKGVDVQNSLDSIEYFHFALDVHAIVYAQGAPSETLYLGAQAQSAMTPEAIAELAALFPELFTSKTNPKPARPLHSKTKDIKELCKRLSKNNKPVLEFTA